MSNQNKTQQSKNHEHNSWDVLCMNSILLKKNKAKQKFASWATYFIEHTTAKVISNYGKPILGSLQLKTKIWSETRTIDCNSDFQSVHLLIISLKHFAELGWGAVSDLT